MGDSHVGLQARLMSQALRKLTANIKRSNTLVIFINQIRMKIGVMFGSPETTTGGNALKFYSSVRLDIRRIGAIKRRDEVIGNQTRIKVVKNKVAPPFKQVEFDILYGEGISREGELIDLGVKHGIVEKSGAWYSYGGERIGQGRDNVREFLKQHGDIADAIDTCVARVAPARGGAPPPTRSRGRSRPDRRRARIGHPRAGAEAARTTRACARRARTQARGERGRQGSDRSRARSSRSGGTPQRRAFHRAVRRLPTRPRARPPAHSRGCFGSAASTARRRTRPWTGTTRTGRKGRRGRGPGDSARRRPPTTGSGPGRPVSWKGADSRRNRYDRCSDRLRGGNAMNLRAVTS